MHDIAIARPSRIRVEADSATIDLEPGEAWGDASTGISVALVDSQVRLTSPRCEVSRIGIRWTEPAAPGARYLGDHWERGYGDLEWRGVVPERVMPWYYLATSDKGTVGRGVKTGAAAIAHWQVDAQGVWLWLDVRSGGAGVRLGARTLTAAHIVQIHSDAPAFRAAQQLCRKLCDAPLLPAAPVYGGNNWYYAYGHSSHEQILADSDTIASLAPSSANRPFMVIDDGWQVAYGNGHNGGPWDRGNDRFPDMARLASEMRSRGVRPGLWVRPLLSIGEPVLDPSRDEVLQRVADDIRRAAEWGYELIKHDFTTFDICGRWGFEMPDRMIGDARRPSALSRTTAEVVTALYRTIHDAAGDALILGCNTIGHLAAGHVQIQRTGDDTSGREWERTRKMGINTLAFRMPQHDTFFAVDADCVGLTNDVPWALNRQWLDLLSASGTPLFVSADPRALGPEQRAAVRDAFARASGPMPVGEPIDWLDTTCPRDWILNGARRQFDWSADSIA